MPTGTTLGRRGLPPKRPGNHRGADLSYPEVTVELTAHGEAGLSDFDLGYESNFTLLGSPRYSASSLRRAKSAPWTSTPGTSSTSRCYRKSGADPSDSALSAYKATVGHVLRGLLDMRQD